MWVLCIVDCETPQVAAPRQNCLLTRMSSDKFQICNKRYEDGPGGQGTNVHYNNESVSIKNARRLCFLLGGAHAGTNSSAAKL